jgi:phosphoribosyl-ATP pyrophosphohydrolase/phosphoribosyl-AMP cyclohydrolase
MNAGEPLGLADIGTLDFAKEDGLLPAVVQHTDTGAVLMVGYMSPDALRETLARRHVVFFSRSKQRLWEKGETSGHFLELDQIRTDCDRDALLVTARPLITKAERFAFLTTLERVIERRIAESPQGSYTARLFAEGPKRIAQKVGEEGLEVALAAAVEPDDKVVAESADLIFHLLVLLRSRGLSFQSVVTELQSRHATKP